ncbi:hypothetical protein CLOSYM_03368 [[Clostridium] symbiosum ATCC 14940]|uniref:Uncharacterized protein n=1 Tax=[Clostridium] symbiosum ATCC 14940 TaxID=411472 RepID=A0ABC9TUP4_CLOSY|nr:hypothetical protein CLOSYM_03368 [[Clostridium] symbiosum ATCC 14940]
MPLFGKGVKSNYKDSTWVRSTGPDLFLFLVTGKLFQLRKEYLPC